jgi:hypothetical protein
MDWEDRLALVTIAEILYDHLKASEDPKDLNILPSDRLRGAIDKIIEGLDRAKERRFSSDDD